MIKLFFFLIPQILLSAPNWLGYDVKLDCLNSQLGNQNFIGINFLLTNSSKPITLQLDFNYDQILIPDSSLYEWGIVCDQSSSDCQRGDQIKEGSFNQFSYKGVDSKVSL